MKTPISKSDKIIYICWSIVLLGAIIFFIYYHLNDIILHTGDRICGFKYFFHLYCPGCGGTRAIDSLFHGRVIQSLLYHPVILYIALFFLSYYIPATLRIIGIINKKIDDMVYVYLLVIFLVILVVHFILRNILVVYAGYDYIGECVMYWKS